MGSRRTRPDVPNAWREFGHGAIRGLQSLMLAFHPATNIFPLLDGDGNAETNACAVLLSNARRTSET